MSVRGQAGWLSTVEESPVPTQASILSDRIAHLPARLNRLLATGGRLYLTSFNCGPMEPQLNRQPVKATR